MTPPGTRGGGGGAISRGRANLSGGGVISRLLSLWVVKLFSKPIMLLCDSFCRHD